MSETNFENVFVEGQLGIKSTQDDNGEADPLCGVEPTLPMYQRLDFVVFAEPAVFKPQQHESTIGRCDKNEKKPQNVIFVNLDQSLINPDSIIVISDNDESIITDDSLSNQDDEGDHVKAVEIYRCDDEQCHGRIFKTSKRLKEHTKRVHCEVKCRYQCWDCGKSFPLQYLLNRHRTVHERKKHKCPICLKMLSLRSSLSLHIRSHSGEKPFTCLACGKSFTRRSGLNSHTRFVHADKTSLDCPHCCTRFTRRITLTAHQRDVHVGKRTLECELCGRCFSNTAALGAHRAKRHESHQGGITKVLPNNPEMKAKTRVPLQPIYHSVATSISVSEQSLNQPQDLSKTASDALLTPNEDAVKSVMTDRLLTDESTIKMANLVPQIPSPERCMQCDTVLPTRWYLIQHIRMHFPSSDILEKEFWCQICEETMTGRSACEEHFDRWHTALNLTIRKFACNVCQKIFKRKEHLNRHMSVHSGEKPHQCHACHRRYSRRSKLVEHLRKEHGSNLPSSREVNARPQNLVTVEMEQGLADGTKAVVVNDGKVVGFKTVRLKVKSDSADEMLSTSMLQGLGKKDVADHNFHPKSKKRKKIKKNRRSVEIMEKQ